MALFNVSTSGQTLYAIGSPAHATSEVVAQNVEDTDFESMRETRVHYQLNNISTSSSTADFLVTNTALANGDRIFIRKNSGEIVDTLASGVTQGTAPIVPNMTSNTFPEGVAFSTDDGADAYKAFDGDPATYISTGNGAGLYLQYTFKDNTPTLVNQYRFHANVTSYSWVLEGSVDGVNFSTISTETARNAYTVNSIWTIDSPGEFSVYRIKPSTGYARWYSFDLLGDGVTADTSAITLGETPDQVFKLEDTISFNGSTATEKDIFYEYGNTGTRMYALVLYEDVALAGRQIVTRVDFSASGNIVTEITGQVFKALA